MFHLVIMQNFTKIKAFLIFETKLPKNMTGVKNAEKQYCHLIQHILFSHCAKFHEN